jgi:hypothetical protein
VLVIGGVEDAAKCRHLGLPVIGSLGGPLDASNTLQNRLLYFCHQSNRVTSRLHVAWGWHAMSVTQKLSFNCKVFAMVDEVDRTSVCQGEHIIIPTTDSWKQNTGVSLPRSSSFSEPLIGVEPTSIILDTATVLESLYVKENSLLVHIVGDMGSWQEILKMAIRLDSADQDAILILPPMYRDYTFLMKAAVLHGVDCMFRLAPQSLRQVDISHAADCAWCPDVAPFDFSTSVLEVLASGWEETALAVPCHHPVKSIPTIGAKIAWATDSLEIFGWLLRLGQDRTCFDQQTAERVVMVRSIAAPTRFIEGLQLRCNP